MDDSKFLWSREDNLVFTDSAELLHRLRQDEEDVELTSVDVVSQILLNDVFATETDGLRLSTVAALQICKAACPGLYRLTEYLCLNDFRHQARDVYNLVVRSRLAYAENMQLVVSPSRGVIEGVVTQKHKRLSNIDLFERTSEVMESYNRPSFFHKGYLVGRSLGLCYTGSEKIGGEDRYAEAMYVANSEVGTGAVRASPGWVREKTGHLVMEAFRRRFTVPHTGKGFRKRFDRMLSAIAESRLEPEEFLSGLEFMRSTPLGFVAGEGDEYRFSRIVSRLKAKGLSGGTASQIVRHALLQGAGESGYYSTPSMLPESVWRSRSVYDLFCAFLEIAEDLSLRLRERFSNLACAVLLRRLKIVGQQA